MITSGQQHLLDHLMAEHGYAPRPFLQLAVSPEWRVVKELILARIQQLTPLCHMGRHLLYLDLVVRHGAHLQSTPISEKADFQDIIAAREAYLKKLFIFKDRSPWTGPRSDYFSGGNPAASSAANPAG